MAVVWLPVRAFVFCLLLLPTKGSANGQTTFMCFGSRCTIGVQFCETGKEVCRNCEDFKENCWQHNKHIANCSDYCRDTFPDSTCKTEGNNEKSTAYYVVCGVLIFMLLISFGLNIWQSCIRYRHTKEKHGNKNENGSFSQALVCKTDEATKLLISEEFNTNDMVVHLSREREIVINKETSDNHQNGFIPPNQIPATNDRCDKPKMVATGKQLNPRDTVLAEHCL